MDDIRFSIVKASSEEFQSIFYKAISWDKKHTFFTSKMPDYDSIFPIMDILETIIICYKDDKPIGYGEIFTEVNVDGIQLLLSYIIDPEYRKKGYGTKLVKQLLILCEEKYKNLGFSDYLSKPFKKDELDEKLKKILGNDNKISWDNVDEVVICNDKEMD